MEGREGEEERRGRRDDTRCFLIIIKNKTKQKQFAFVVHVRV